ncbi:MAG: hypothetical protein AAGF95_00055 [Chloroflexota bacterium]
MAGDAAALIVVLPTDTVETIIAKIRDTGALSVQLLVPDGLTVLQSVANLTQIQQTLAQDNIKPILISSDEQILVAAAQNQLDVISVKETRVNAPSGIKAPADTPSASTEQTDTPPIAKAPADRSYETQVFAEKNEPPPSSLDPSPDDVFLDALDNVPADFTEADYAKEDFGSFSTFDDFSDPGGPPLPKQQHKQHVSDKIEAEETIFGHVPLDDEWDSALIDDLPSPRRSGYTDVDTPPRRGNSPTTIDPNDAYFDDQDEFDRPGPGRHLQDFDDFDRPAPKRKRRGVIFWILFLLILGGGGAISTYAFTQNTTINVWPTASTVSEEPFEEVVPIAPSSDDIDGAVVQARVITAEASTSVQGQANAQLTPVGVARGTIVILNSLAQSIDLPEGTEFVATNDQGQEVRFLIDGAATIPPAISTARGVTFGEISVQVSALSPGSASNVGPDTVTQMIIPGQQPVGSGNPVNFENDAITGGTEEEVNIVSRDDIQVVLGTLLTDLYSAGITQLSQQINSGEVIDEQSITPNTLTLGDPANYEPLVVEPAIGETVDPENPFFTVTTSTGFSALASPTDASISEQLSVVIGEYLRQEDRLPCSPQELSFGQPTWVWDGQSLTVEGVMICTPLESVDDGAMSQIQNAVRNQSRSAAEESLRQLVSQGIIGGFELPENRATFPPFDMLININITAPPSTEGDVERDE